MIALVRGQEHQRVLHPLLAVAADGPEAAAPREVLVNRHMIGRLPWRAQPVIGDVALVGIAVEEAEVALHRIVDELARALPLLAVLRAMAIVAVAPGGLALDRAPALAEH